MDTQSPSATCCDHPASVQVQYHHSSMPGAPQHPRHSVCPTPHLSPTWNWPNCPAVGTSSTSLLSKASGKTSRNFGKRMSLKQQGPRPVLYGEAPITSNVCTRPRENYCSKMNHQDLALSTPVWTSPNVRQLSLSSDHQIVASVLQRRERRRRGSRCGVLSCAVLSCAMDKKSAVRSR